MKILLVAQNLQIGGVQTSLVNLLQELSKDESIELHLFVFSKGSLLSHIPKVVKVFYGNYLLRLVATPFAAVRKARNIFDITVRIFCMLLVRLLGSKRFYRLLFRLQNRLQEYDIAISYFNDVPNNYFNQGTNLFVDEFTNAKMKLAWIHNDPILAKFDHEYCKNLYRNFDRLVHVSEACKEKFDSFLPEYKSKSVVVYNFFQVEVIKRKSTEYKPFDSNNETINIVTVGRIDNYQKRLEKVVEVSHLLSKAGIRNFKWRVVGEGPDLNKNIQLTNELGVYDLVEFVGNRENPYPFIRNSDIFVLTSAFEGYPMVVEESLILGVPVVATCYAAAREQIEQGITGIIVDMETDKIFEVIKELLLNPSRITKMVENLQIKEFSNRRALKQLMSILNENSKMTHSLSN